MIPQIRIWEGSASFSPGESTPYGYFDSDTKFMIDAEKTAVWVARRLGYPIQDVELVSEQIFTAFEEATMAYSSYINKYESRDRFLDLQGQHTGSLNLSEQYIKPDLNGMFKLADEYANPVGAGGNLKYYTGSVTLKEGVQIYDLNSNTTNLERGDFESDNFTIRRIFYDRGSKLANYLSPLDYSGIGNQQVLREFGWGNYGVEYTLLPLHFDLMKMQAIGMHNKIRKSAYSFQLTANRLRIFPIPRSGGKLHFEYTIDNENIDNPEIGKISSYSNLPYGYKKYKYINSMGQNWIKRYTLALCKQMLGLIRSKYSDIPMTGDSTISLNGSELVSQGENEIEKLVNELTDYLETTSKQELLQRKADEAESLANTLKWVPNKIYIK